MNLTFLSLLLNLHFGFNYELCMHPGWFCICECRALQGPENSIRPLRTAVPGDFELPSVNAETRTHALPKVKVVCILCIWAISSTPSLLFNVWLHSVILPSLFPSCHIVLCLMTPKVIHLYICAGQSIFHTGARTPLWKHTSNLILPCLKSISSAWHAENSISFHCVLPHSQ